MSNSEKKSSHSDHSPDIESWAPGVGEGEGEGEITYVRSLYDANVEIAVDVDRDDGDGERSAPVSDDNDGAGDGSHRREDNWVIDLQRTLEGCMKEKLLGAGNIFRVPKEIREANKDKMDCYKPQFVAMGPFHRRTTIDLQTMEFTKWRSVDYLLGHRSRTLPHPFSMSIKVAENLIRACYGEEVEMASEQFSTMMLQDACFLLKLLLWLHDHDNLTSPDPDQEFIPVYIDDYKKMSRLLTDLTLLENQIPFFLLILLSRILLVEAAPPQGQEEQPAAPSLGRGEQPAAGLRALSEGAQLSPVSLARFFQCDVARVDFSKGVYHFLHLIHSFAPDPYHQPPQDYHEEVPPQLCHREFQLQLRRSAIKLQALGIKIIGMNEPVEENVGPRTMVSDLVWEFMGRFEFKIEFNKERRELIIPTLHIKEATEVKWRNFIAWEQMGRLIGVGYKFTSYAYFFKGLVCSVHDIQLLREKGVIKVYPEAKDEDLLIMFQSIAAGAERMDDRYRQVCKRLNKAKVNGVGGCFVFILRMLRHYWRRFLEWLLRGLISLPLSFMHTYCYLGGPWKFIGVVSGAALLGLTIIQTIYAIRAGAVK